MKNKILLVDDEEDIRDVLGLFLEDMGYQIFSAENGEDALQIFRKENPPIILSDIKMPGMDGTELLQKIKQENREAEVIMITGHGDMDLAIMSLKYEAADFVTKPINDDILEIALNRAEERISMRQKIKEYTENLEKLVEEKSRQLIAAERLAAVGQTVAGLSHAIKNIAGGLKGGIFVLGKGIELDNKTYLSQGWEMVKGNVDKIQRLSLDLLSYSKTKETEYRLCDPNIPASEVASLMKSEAEEYNIDLKTALSPDLKPVYMDTEGIHRSLLDIVANAIDACKADSKPCRKEVILNTVKPEGFGVEYQITDNGCGMDEDVKKHLFQEFFSTKGTTCTGIGLMMTKKIIDEHHGLIKAESEKGIGSEFIIRLPEIKNITQRR